MKCSNLTSCDKPLLTYFDNIYLPKTKKFGCVGRGDLTSLFFSKVAK